MISGTKKSLGKFLQESLQEVFTFDMSRYAMNWTEFED